MAIPTTGPVSASDINVELDRTSTSQISLDDARSGVYSTINDASDSIPPSTGEISYSDWRGYDHDATSGPTLGGPTLDKIGISISQFSSRGICFQGAEVAAYFESPFDTGSAVYSDAGGTKPLSDGWYNTEEGVAFEMSNGVIQNTLECEV